MSEQTIRGFWDAHPCGDAKVGGLANAFADNYREFFDAYDAWRYTQEAHILRLLDGLDIDGKRLLEIGLGQGADAEQLIRRGARWSGVDVSEEAVKRVEMRAALRALPIDEVRQASVLNLPWPDDSFDVVFSHGVLHHVPDVVRAQREICRVLRPDGALVVMLYARHSLNFQVSIRVLRRVALLALYPAFCAGIARPRGMVGDHLASARAMGLMRYLRLEQFTHRSTDGPFNPYSRVYSVKDVARDFPNFQVVKTYKAYLHAPPLPLRKFRRIRLLESLMGWHLWAHLEPRAGRAVSSGSPCEF